MPSDDRPPVVQEIGAASMLVDEHRVLTDDRLDIITSAAALDIELAGPACEYGGESVTR